MGDDEYHPIERKGSNLTSAGGIGYTVVDSIDTMLIMGLDEEYQRARDWIENKLSFERDANFNTFEVRFFLVSSYQGDAGELMAVVSDDNPSPGRASLCVPLHK